MSKLSQKTVESQRARRKGRSQRGHSASTENAADHKKLTSALKGRGKKSLADSIHRAYKSLAGLEDRVKAEVLSVVAQMFCEGKDFDAIRAAIKTRHKLFDAQLGNETMWDMVRAAAQMRLFEHIPGTDMQLEKKLRETYPWLRHYSVAQTASTEALAALAADRLLTMICDARKHKGREEVHVGFAGGMTLRAVAAKLARLLTQRHDNLPSRIVFHAMVASLDDDDFYADPNSFITYFLASDQRVKVRLVRLPLPGIIEANRYNEMRELGRISRIFERRSEIDIVVTSGSLWRDRGSTLRQYFEAAKGEEERKSGIKNVLRTEQMLNDARVIGDVLWQPINDKGPIDIHMDYKIVTLMSLQELTEFAKKGGDVLLVMGCSGVSPHSPKSELLKAILDLYPTQHWVTELVSDTQTVEGIFYPISRALQ